VKKAVRQDPQNQELLAELQKIRNRLAGAVARNTALQLTINRSIDIKAVANGEAQSPVGADVMMGPLDDEMALQIARGRKERAERMREQWQQQAARAQGRR